MNTLFEYRYRDASNHKQLFQVIFSGEITPEEEDRLREHLDSGEYFIAGDVGLPELQWEMDGFPNEDDHVWHELSEILLVDQPPTDETSIHDFVERFCAAKWDEEAAMERLGMS